MTSRSSSISSSEPAALEPAALRRYLLRLATTTAVLVVLAAAVAVVGLRQGWLTWHFSQLMHYQLDKLENADGVEVLLVGDSALGNAIDAAAWSKALDRPVLSVALTGAYGYAGSLNMIRRALRRQPLQAVVVFQTLDLMTRPPADSGLVLTAERLSDLADAPPGAIWSTLVNLSMPLNVHGTLLSGPPDERAAYAPTDYVPQVGALSAGGAAEHPDRPLSPAALRSRADPYLATIGELCRTEGLRCVYTHGPLTRSICAGSGNYVVAANERIRAAGLTPVEGTPLCLAWVETGDSEDHVAPAHKATYSARYLELIAPLLAPPAATEEAP
jgi:hypothetical protein